MSVCIVHRDGWCVTDSRANFGCTGVSPLAITKAFSTGSILVACVGEAIVQQDLEHLLVEEPQSVAAIDVISAYMKENEGKDSPALTVDLQRNLILVDPSGFKAVYSEGQDFWAVGCAADMVIGYLMRVASTERVTVEHAKEAVVMASRFDSGIDDKCQVVWIKG